MPHLRFKIPVSVYVTSPTAGEPNLVGEFTQDDSRVEYRMTGALPAAEVPTLPAHQRYVKHCTELEFTIQDAERLSLTAMVQAAEWPRLQTALVSIANRVLRGIRNFGTVPHLSELRPRPDPLNTERHLRSWELSLTDATGEFQRVFQEDGALAALLQFGARAELPGEMDAFRWLDIVEAIHANLQPEPEQEFLTNALEHARLDNYRYALLEAIICLEIVMTQFLRSYLTRKSVPNHRINKFVNPQLGLTARVAALPDLMLDRPLPPGFINRALDAIEWRNEVIHKTGRLPLRSEQEIRDGVAAVLGVASILALKRDELVAEPQMREVSQQLAAELGVSISRLPPVLKAQGQHRVVVDFSYISPNDVPTEEEMRRLVERVSELVAARDAGFDQSRHLLVRFLVLPNEVRARWAGGELFFTRRPPETTPNTPN